MSLDKLLSLISPAPDSWFEGLQNSNGHSKAVELSKCTSYSELIDVWKEAMHWTDSLDITLSAMLAVVASTKLLGSQIWLRVIGPAGSAKTTLCEAISANTQYTFPMSLVTGFHSGYTGPGSDGDASLIPKIDGKTTIINEGDMILKAPNREQTMAELRDLYSGVARSIYRNGKMSFYEGLRCTFILAGTPSLRQLNRSALGDRFLDCIVFEREPGSISTAERQLVKAVAMMAVARCKSMSNGSVDTRDSPAKVLAYQKTAGYVKYLRETIEDSIKDVDCSEAIVDDCTKLAELVAAMRTRAGGGDEDATEPELATRLGEQLVRFALCLSPVLQQPINSEVMRRVAHIAEDTCYGHTFDIVKLLIGRSLGVRELALQMRKGDDATRKFVTVLLSIGAIRADLSIAPSGAKNRNSTVYRLSPQTAGLYSKMRSLIGEA